MLQHILLLNAEESTQAYGEIKFLKLGHFPLNSTISMSKHLLTLPYSHFCLLGWMQQEQQICVKTTTQ